MLLTSLGNLTLQRYPVVLCCEITVQYLCERKIIVSVSDFMFTVRPAV